MRNYNLNIAGYNIRFESSSDGPELLPAERFLRNLSSDTRSDVMIRIHTGVYNLPEESERVFHAPYVEEINGLRISNKTNFWSIWKHRPELFIKTVFPLSFSEKNAVLKFSLISKEWDLWFDRHEKDIDPLEYPLDGLVLYYLTVIYGDILIHASGINNAGHGYIFSGVSGKGKSTIARLWENSGAVVIHDDRLILRRIENSYHMFNTPVYNNDEPDESVLNKIFIIEHGISNKLVPVKGAKAISLVMANCIQHNWGQDIIARLLASVSEMCAIIPVVKLSFQPEKSVVDYILENE
jgi:hypothetical protein